MFPFWKTVIGPAIQASGARRIVEIGALRGENTSLMLDDLPPDAELHVIDPVPVFDPEEHAVRFGGRYVFHRDLSLDVLGSLGAFDAAIIDGDHNWYTVLHELRALRESSRQAGRALPLCVLHDVGWPYGRRDLYYDPATIPQEYRQPHAKGGMRPGRSALGRGGMNVELHNARHEGGARNGVMTAIEDFLAEQDEAVRLLVIPAYFGLAILADESLLAARPDLAAFLDHLESAAGKDEIAELAESIRLDAAVFEQNVSAHRNRVISAGIERYLGLLKTALCGQLDPSAGPTYSVLTPMGRARLDQLDTLLTEIWWNEVPGDLVDVGVGRGESSIFMLGWLEAYGVSGRQVWIVDERRVDGQDDGDLNTVRDGFARHGLPSQNVRFVGGPIGGGARSVDAPQIALLRIGPEVRGDAINVLEALHDRVAPGGIVLVDASEGDETLAAVHTFRAQHAVDDALSWSDRQVVS